MSLETLPWLPPKVEMVRALTRHDPSYDGVFFTAVKTTGIFCRPSCPSLPDPKNVEFFQTARQCLFAGYRACKRCLPMEVGGPPPAWVANLMAKVDGEPDRRWQAEDLRQLGIPPEKARRWFLAHHGMTFAAWCRSRRLTEAFTRIRNGESLDDATFGAGFGSHSGFRSAFVREHGRPPGDARSEGDRIVTMMYESPIGTMLLGTSDRGICLVEFSDRRMLEHNVSVLRRKLNCPISAGKHPNLDLVHRQLVEYFERDRRDFSVPLDLRGTPFQEKVWKQLQHIPYGTTWSYDQLATRVGQPTAQRAVARANGMNRICIVIPCHRVIGKDGSLTGYGGGMWRKRLLLNLESGI